jgi:hypothetical protein
MTKRKAHKYTGVLNRPMRRPTPKNALAILTPAQLDAELLHQRSSRMMALAKDCGADPETTDWFDVAFTLAERHVPGFEIAGGQSSPAKAARDRKNRRVIFEMVRLIEGERRLKIRAAAGHLAKKWNRKRDGAKEISADAIDRRYRRLVKES